MSLIPKKSLILSPEPNHSIFEPSNGILSRLPGANDGGRGTRMLLIHSGHLGDAVLALSAMRRARRTLPNADIRAMVIPPADQLLRACGWCNEVWTLPRLSAARSLTPHLEWLKLFGRTSRFAPHLSVCFSPDPEGQVFMAVSAASIRVSASKKHNWIYTRAWMTHSLPWRSLAISRAERYQRIADAAGFRNVREPGLAGITVPRQAQEIVDGLIGRSGEPRVALLVCGSQKAKRWPLEAYAELAKGLYSRTECKPIVVTGPGETDLLDAVDRTMVKPGVALHLHNAPLLSLVALLQICDAVVSVDSGPGHIAAALGCSTVYLVTQKNLRGFVPPGVHAVAGKTIQDISVSDVSNALDDILTKREMSEA
ncbi:MAG: glycosyltransferase family 9 protein [Planctomycetaceae bacterium]|nr:glycosyltransferase family 9 protein [Planctomycetaceae bacterium]